MGSSIKSFSITGLSAWEFVFLKPWPLLNGTILTRTLLEKSFSSSLPNLNSSFTSYGITSPANIVRWAVVPSFFTVCTE